MSILNEQKTYTSQEAQQFFDLLTEYRESKSATEVPAIETNEALRLAHRSYQETARVISKASPSLASHFNGIPSWKE